MRKDRHYFAVAVLRCICLHTPRPENELLSSRPQCRHPQTAGGLRPFNNDNTARIKNTKKQIFAAVYAMPPTMPNPRAPAISAITKNTTLYLNIKMALKAISVRGMKHEITSDSMFAGQLHTWRLVASPLRKDPPRLTSPCIKHEQAVTSHDVRVFC